MKKKNVFISILLSIITLGIYSLFWSVDLIFDSSNLFDKNETKPFKKIMFMIITFGLYGVYWVYKVGKKISIKDKKIKDKSILYSIMNIMVIIFALYDSNIMKIIALLIGIGIISILQNDINKLIDHKKIK